MIDRAVPKFEGSFYIRNVMATGDNNQCNSFTCNIERAEP